MHMTIDQFGSNEIGAAATVKKQQAICFQCFETKIDENIRVGLQHGQPDVRMFGAERGRMIDIAWR